MANNLCGGFRRSTGNFFLQETHECGSVVGDRYLYGSGLANFDLTANITDAETVNNYDANNNVCDSVTTPASIDNYTAALTFCNLNVQAASIFTGRDPLTDFAGNVIGTGLPLGAVDSEWILGIDVRPSGGSACAVGGASVFWRGLFKGSGGVITHSELNNADAVTFVLEGALLTPWNQGLGYFADDGLPLGAINYNGDNVAGWYYQSTSPLPNGDCTISTLTSDQIATVFAVAPTNPPAGEWGPPTATRPASLSALQASTTIGTAALTAAGVLAYPPGSGIVLGDGSVASWSGAAWVAGAAPASAVVTPTPEPEG